MKALKLNWLVLLCILLCLSCRTKQITVSGHTKNDQMHQNDVSVVGKLKASLELDETSLQKSVINDSTETEIKITEWSNPDSTGRQFPVKTTEINKKGVKRTHIDVKSESRQSGGVAAGLDVVDKSKTKKSQEAEVKTSEKIRSSTWLISVCIILSLGLVVLLYFILRRFGLVK